MSMGAGGREQTMQNVVLIRRDGLKQCRVSASVQLLGCGGGRREITESLRLPDKTFDSAALPGVSKPPPIWGGVHQPGHGRCTADLVQRGGREAVVAKDTQRA